MTAPAVDRELLDLAVTVAQRAGDVAAGRFSEASFTTAAKAEPWPGRPAAGGSSATWAAWPAC